MISKSIAEHYNNILKNEENDLNIELPQILT